MKFNMRNILVKIFSYLLSRICSEQVGIIINTQILITDKPSYFTGKPLIKINPSEGIVNIDKIYFVNYVSKTDFITIDMKEQ